MLLDSLQQILEDQCNSIDRVNASVLGLDDLKRIRNIFKSAPLVQLVDFSAEVPKVDFAVALTKLDDDETLILLNLSSCSEEIEEIMSSVLTTRSLELIVGEGEVAKTTVLPLNNFAVLAVESAGNSIPMPLSQHFNLRVDFSEVELDANVQGSDDEPTEDEQPAAELEPEVQEGAAYELDRLSFAQVQLNEEFDPNVQEVGEHLYIVTKVDDGAQYYYYPDFDGRAQAIDSLEEFIETHWLAEMQSSGEPLPPCSTIAAMISAVLSDRKDEFTDEHGCQLLDIDAINGDLLSAHLGKFVLLHDGARSNAKVLPETAQIRAVNQANPIDICEFIQRCVEAKNPQATLLDQVFE